MRIPAETSEFLNRFALDECDSEGCAAILSLVDKLNRERIGPLLVYIAGPFSGATRAEVAWNIASAELAGLAVARMGVFPFIPHTNTGHESFEKAQPYDFWIAGTMAMLYRCDAVLMVDEWQRSKGAVGERDAALRIGMPVFDSSQMAELKEWIERAL
jgi:hypothetical protein